MLSSNCKKLCVMLFIALGVQACSSSSGESEKQKPGAPSVSVIARHEANTILWPSVSDVLRYDLHWTDSPDLPEEQWPVFDNVQSPHDHIELVNGTTYSYYVIAVNKNGQISTSNVVSATPKPPPQAPQLSIAGNTDNSISLSWAKVTDAQKYFIYAAGAEGVAPANYATLPGGQQIEVDGSQNSVTISNLLPGVEYFFVITAFNDSGESFLPSNEVSEMLKPVAPVVSSVVPGHISASISWQSVNGAEKYNVYIAKAAGLTPDNPTNLDGFTAYRDVSSPVFIDQLVNYQNYYFIVTAVNALEDESDPSVEASFQPFNDTPIVAGVSHTCALKNDRSIYCWGENTNGQLGIGTGNSTGTRSSPQRIGEFTDWNDISTGEQHSCAVSASGLLACWGYNAFGQLGTGNGNDMFTPQTQFNDAGWRLVDTGYQHTCGIDALGDIYCWGNGDAGQLGVGKITRTYSSWHQSSKVIESGPWNQVSAGYAHTCAIKNNPQRSLYCWGDASDGRIGVNISSYSEFPVYLSSGWKTVDAGYKHSCGIKTSGTLWCWGENVSGQLGIGVPGNPDRTATGGQVGTAQNWIRVVAGRSHSCALNDSGEIFCWGSNSLGQLGIPNTADKLQTQMNQIPGNNWASISATNSHTCASRTDGSFWCWGSNRDAQLAYSAIPNTFNKLSATPAPVNGETDWESISTGKNHSCAVKTNNTLWCWGSNDFGQLGNGTTIPEHTPIQIGVDKQWTLVNAGDNHTCAVAADNNQYCWGENFSGELGINSLTPAFSTQIQQVVDAGQNWKQLELGGAHSCALRTGGTISCWGEIDNGRLGIGDLTGLTDQLIPVTLQASPVWSHISLGMEASCAVGQVILQPGDIVDDGLYCWGSTGVVRNNTTNDVLTPLQIETSIQWNKVSVGTKHICALDSDNVIHCWGDNTYGQLGNNIDNDSIGIDIPQPTLVSGNDSWSAISSSYDHVCAIKTNGNLYCWGRSKEGQVGVGVFEFYDVYGERNVPQPEQLNSDLWKTVDTGKYHTCGMKQDNTLWCWGDNHSGQLGNGSPWNDELVNIDLP